MSDFNNLFSGSVDPAELLDFSEAVNTMDCSAQFEAECDEIAAQCEAEGYPSHGSNYEQRVEQLMRSYPDLFGDEEEEDDEYV